MTAASSSRRRGGKSGLRRTRCWVTPSPGNGKESATERRPPPPIFCIGGGKGERAR